MSIRDRFPIFKTKTYFNSCSQGALSIDVQQAYNTYLRDWDEKGSPWELWVERSETARQAFAGFDPAKVARFSAARVEQLLLDPGLVRNRLKIHSAVKNARAFLAIQKEYGTFDAYVWRFVGNHPIARERKSRADVPAKTKESDALSKDLQKRGFNFAGSTIVYAYMQATGLVKDHTVGCFRLKNTA